MWTGFYEIKWTLRLKKLNILVLGDFKANSFMTNHIVNASIKNKRELSQKLNYKHVKHVHGIVSFRRVGYFS